jgi:hypothetical protein
MIVLPKFIPMTGWWLTHPSEKIWKSVGIMIPNIWKNKNGPNHQPDYINNSKPWIRTLSFCTSMIHPILHSYWTSSKPTCFLFGFTHIYDHTGVLDIKWDYWFVVSAIHNYKPLVRQSSSSYTFITINWAIKHCRTPYHYICLFGRFPYYGLS